MKISVEAWRMSNEPGLIHLASSDGKTFHAQVTNVEGRAGFYPYLYGKLGRMLEAAGEGPVMPKADQWSAYEEVIQRKLACSFCDRTRWAVRKLIAGPRGVYICDECIDLCNEIIEEEGVVPSWPWRRIDSVQSDREDG